jgi:hypothetical protein
MKKGFIVLLALGFSTTHASTLYKCTDDLGHSTYTNFKTPNRNCVVLSRDVPTAASSSKPGSGAAATPADFPKVTSETQRGRDNDRRVIVQRESETEQKNLDEAKKNLAQQESAHATEDLLKPIRDRVALHERNLVELQRELAKLR